MAIEKREVSERLLGQIRSLLARQNHATANENEATACAGRVSALLLKHGLDMADIAEKLGEGEKDKDAVLHDLTPMGVNPGASMDWCLTLAGAVSRATFTRQLAYVKDRVLLFVGEPTDVAVAKELYHFLSQQVQRLMINGAYAPPPVDPRGKIWNKEVRLHGFKFLAPVGWYPTKTRKLPSEQDAGKWCRAFLEGCAARVAERLDEETRKARWAENAAKVNALVRVKEEAVQAYVDLTWPKTRMHQRSRQPLQEAGLAAGYKAGDQVRLNKRDRLTDGPPTLPPNRRSSDAR